MDCSYHLPTCMHAPFLYHTQPHTPSSSRIKSQYSICHYFISKCLFIFPWYSVDPAVPFHIPFILRESAHTLSRLEIGCIVSPSLSITRVICNCDFCEASVERNHICIWQVQARPPKWTCKIRHSLFRFPVYFFLSSNVPTVRRSYSCFRL